ncbi:MAG: hypothetical protein ACI4WX_04220 [Aristaeellaceae bacterium]
MQKKNKVGHFVGSIVNIAEQAMPTGVQKDIPCRLILRFVSKQAQEATVWNTSA